MQFYAAQLMSAHILPRRLCSQWVAAPWAAGDPPSRGRPPGHQARQPADQQLGQPADRGLRAGVDGRGQIHGHLAEQAGAPRRRVPTPTALPPRDLFSLWSSRVDLWNIGRVVRDWARCFPTSLSDDEHAIVKSFYRGTPERRFSIAEMKAHPFLAGIDFDALANSDIPVPSL
ncbi:hypothetical protein B0H17DRAFT_707091 [Mycena rosella]|uniref:Protein kinase domain-containing protein n=1 Tax=Mycena rosella TaxID=1033263 RepID=A0AAD7DAG1_MYCRO|nr:hypothetical protein B0H17DRAFT_707091 [Mycena rosella]